MIRRILNKIGKNKMAIALILILFAALLPMIVAAALTLKWMHRRKLLRLAESFSCVVCGSRLGAGSIRLGNARWLAIMVDLQAKHPRMKLRIVRSVHAVCPECGCEYRYCKADDAFVANPHQKSTLLIHINGHPVTIKTNHGPHFVAFASLADGRKYLQRQPATYSFGTLEEILKLNPGALPRQFRALYLDSPKTVEQFVNDPEYFPANQHLVTLSHEAAPPAAPPATGQAPEPTNNDRQDELKF
jgi:hypothetical protein